MTQVPISSDPLSITSQRYTLGELRGSSSKWEVYAALRNEDGLRVIAKVDARCSADPDPGNAGGRHGGARSSLHHELRVLRKVEGPGIVRALELDESGGRPLLILEDVGGVSLRRYAAREPLPLERFLSVAVQVGRALARVHAAHVVHKNLKPSNVLLHVPSGGTWLKNFDLAAEVDEDTRRPHAPGGTLPYMAPEQTGRMNRGIDARSDLYSLGATLYELLTGRLPFPFDDPRALIHAHLARRPQAPHELCPTVPETLSGLVLKLLEKQPEKRYQSAAALVADLVELEHRHLDAGHLPHPFPLGRAQAPPRPVFGKRLYGRDPEIRTLQGALERVQAPSSELVLIQGPPGIGKSALLEELQRVVARGRGYLVQGRFDPYRRDLPYAGFTSAFQSLVEQVLLESRERVEGWARELRREMGKLTSVMIELVPQLSHVLAGSSTLPRLGPRQTRQRLALAVERFVDVFATREHPLVLCLDDLQWADAGSRYLMERLLGAVPAGSAPGRALLFVATCQDAGLGASHPVVSLLEGLGAEPGIAESIVLGPLSLEASTAMLVEALGHTEDETRWLAECVARKTGNNPLLIRQFTLHMHDLGHLRFETAAGWVWNEAELLAADAPDDAVELLTSKMERLEAGTRNVLKYASCIGNEFDSGLIAQLSHLSHKMQRRIESCLYVLDEAGLIAPCPQGFRFVHHRIREAAQALCSPQELAQLHYDVGHMLLEQTPPSQLPGRLYEIVDHLQRAADHIPDSERLRVMEINLMAARQAMAAGAPATAAGYLAMGRGLSQEVDWEEHRDLVLDLGLESVEAAVQTADFATARTLLDELDGRALTTLVSCNRDSSHKSRPLLHSAGVAPPRRIPNTPRWKRLGSTQNGLDLDATNHGSRTLEGARITAARIALYALTRSPQRTAEVVLKALAELGHRWPERPSRLRLWLEILRTDWALRRARRQEGDDPGATPDERTRALQVVLGATFALARVSARLHLMLLSLDLRLMAKWGPPPEAGRSAFRRARSLMGYPLYRGLFLPGASTHPHAVSVGLLSRTGTDAATRHWAQYKLYSHVNPWQRPRRQSIEPLARTVDALTELGDLEWANYARVQGAWIQAFTGVPLDRVEPALREAKIRFGGRGRSHVFSLSLLSDENLASLDDELERARPLFQRLRTRIDPTVASLWMLVLVVYGRHAEAFDFSQQVRPRVFEVWRGGTFITDYCFLRGIAAARVAAATTSGSRRREYRRVLRRNRKRLQRWATPGNDFGPMASFLAAEEARLGGKVGKALSLWRRVAEEATQREYHHYAALAHESATLYLLDLHRRAQAASELRRAARGYELWGAGRKLVALYQEHGALLAASDPASPLLGARQSQPSSRLQEPGG